MRKILPAVLLGVCGVLLSGSFFTVSANSRVLGETTQNISLPPTAEGPGYILPDSPFYFLDLIKQEVRLSLAFTPLMKARVYSSIAGERIAELRFELGKQNIPAAEIALQGLRDNTKMAAETLANAKFWGMETAEDAININRSIKEHQVELDVLEAQATGELKEEAIVAQATLTDAKTKVEASLPQPELDNEIADDLRRQAVRSAMATSDSAQTLADSLSMLQNQATMAAKNQQGGKVTKNQKPSATDTSMSIRAQALLQADDILQKAQSIAKEVIATQPVITPTPTPIKK